jgi:hypothetical protein
MKTTLYHGTTMVTARSSLKNGFDFTKCGSNWGSTYGKGIYFSPNYDEAQFYADKDGMVLSFELELSCYYLKKDVSPSKKIDFKLPDGYNCLVNPNNDEYVVFSFISPLVSEVIELYEEFYYNETPTFTYSTLLHFNNEELIDLIMTIIDEQLEEGKLEEYYKYAM